MLVRLQRMRFKKYSTIRFHDSSPSGIRVVPIIKTDMTEQIDLIRNFANSYNFLLSFLLPFHRPCKKLLTDTFN